MNKSVFKSLIPNEKTDFFFDLYKEHGVEVVGSYKNVDNDMEFYLITAYRDEDHYKEFVSMAANHPKYKELTEEIKDKRTSVEMVTLEDAE